MSNSSRELLDGAYSGLGYAQGDLLSTTATPDATNARDWVNKGDWLALAKQVRAEKIFFVNDYPVIVFAEQSSDDPDEWVQFFNSIWCMARPQLLFLAKRGELQVFDLSRRPARPGEQRENNRRLLRAVATVAEVQEALAEFRREQVESGRLFEDERFGSDDRADRALIRDLGRVRRALIDGGLSPGHAHALIGRSIFIRYLEDRGVLVEEYFRQVAARGETVNWNQVLDNDAATAMAAGSGKAIHYPRVLNNKLFTYALFDALSRDFNGDMFPVDEEEERSVKERHLHLLRRFLLGDSEEGLFFFAYQFDIIPIELISSIYEKFYSTKPDQQRDDGSYYTPAALVEFVLSQTLDEERLAKSPRVLDPACGSGIFLVESYRRMVRFRVKQSGSRLSRDELRSILRDQIRGIDIHREAIRVAAFSLYLAMLHYLEPKDIRQQKLPSLTYRRRTRPDRERHFDILLVSDAFQVEENVAGAAAKKRFTTGCADIVVGNPPWGKPASGMPDELRSDGGVGWCGGRGLSLGNKERSQSFIHLTMDMLANGGRAGLLVSTGVFFKRHDKTRKFRHQWLSAATLRRVINFAAVRHAFFRVEGERQSGEGDGAVAPFASVVFDKGLPPEDSFFTYWSAKETAFVKRVQAVVLNQADFCHARQSEFQRDETLWKIYWWGNHRDEALIRRLRLERTLTETFDPAGDRLQSGFKEVSRDQASGWLRTFKEFPARAFCRYGPLPRAAFVSPPTRVERRRERWLYEGARLLIKRGVNTDEVAQGRIVARYQDEPFCFRHSIYALPMVGVDEVSAKAVLGILWSSLTRYYLFMTSGTWGMWHDEVLKETLATLPVRLPASAEAGERVAKIVDELRAMPDPVEEVSLFEEAGQSVRERLATVRALEAKLDQAVFSLFELSEGERERISELCNVGLDLFYNGMASDAVNPVVRPAALPRFGYSSSLRAAAGRTEMGRYLATYLRLWEPRLKAQRGRFRWHVILPEGASSMMAVIFQTELEGEPLPPPEGSDEQMWGDLLRKLQNSSWQAAGAKRIYIDGLVKFVSETDIVIIKRNEKRLWTASTARDDAEATMLMAMRLSANNGK